jgi:hypothetical protein
VTAEPAPRPDAPDAAVHAAIIQSSLFAALAVILSLLGFVLPSLTKPVLVVLELGVTGTILIVTCVGNRAGWHRRWLDSRNLAALIDGQVGYLSQDAARMHTLEHRLHRLGLMLFGATALVCVATVTLKAMSGMGLHLAADRIEHSLAVWLTICSAAFPAMGAAIYGIRMQGDFAGIAERNEALIVHLGSLRRAIDADALDFDTLRRGVRRATDLLTAGLDDWLQTYHARPLALPG